MSDERSHQSIVLVTGPAGAGRQTALHALEDFGYEAIDNLPLRLVDPLLATPGTDLGVALGLDPRGRDFSARNVSALLDTLIAESDGPAVQLVYLDCANETLIKRFSETRRRHPLADSGSVEAAISDEKTILAPLRGRADVLVDTTDLSVHDLRARLAEEFSPGAQTTLDVTVQSFSYKRGLPPGSDLVFDCRFLRNPYWEPALRDLSGLDPSVQDYVSDDARFSDFAHKTIDLVQMLLPAYSQEGKSHLTVAFGCTGGRHRSVTLAERCAAALADSGWQVSIKHRDLDRRKRDEAAA